MATTRCGAQARIVLARRLTFFAFCPQSLAWQDHVELPDELLLGYAVILTMQLPDGSRRTYLLEAVIRPPSVTYESPNNGILTVEVPNYYVHSTRSFDTHLGTQRHNRMLTFEGSFFTQQNDLTSVCAHAALRTAVNSCAGINGLQAMTQKGKLTNQYINDILGIDFSSPRKTLGHYSNDDQAINRKLGLTREDIHTVVESLGARLLVSNFIEDLSVDYDEFMYPLVESRLPTILEVEGWDRARNQMYAHALAVTGHTLNSDRWEPEANVGYGKYPKRQYIQVCEWVCHYVINDDNYGMNVTLPSSMVRNDIVPYKNPNLHATRVMSIVPRKITWAGYTAQRRAVSIARAHIRDTRLASPSYWLDKLKERNQDGNLVFRTVLQENDAYRRYMEDLIQKGIIRATNAQRAYLSSLPKYLWITEVSIPHLYSGNKAKLGEVVVDASASQKDIESGQCVFMAWFPGFLRHRSKQRSELFGVDTHVPLIRRNGLPLIEW